MVCTCLQYEGGNKCKKDLRSENKQRKETRKTKKMQDEEMQRPAKKKGVKEKELQRFSQDRKK